MSFIDLSAHKALKSSLKRLKIDLKNFDSFFVTTMVAPAFPIVKLGIILIQHLSKPAVKIVSKMAVKYTFVRVNVCRSGNQFHNIDTKLRSNARNEPSVSGLSLSEEQAIEKGAHLLSEILLFTIASIIAIYQYNKNMKRKAAVDLEIKTLKTRIEQLECSLQNKS